MWSPVPETVLSGSLRQPRNTWALWGTVTRPIPVLDDVRSWQILLQKSFWGEEQKFREPLMRFTRGDVRDHIGSSKIDH
jgi:hypothetical protein